jgi:heme-degrading monooxygenase HmoA
MRTNVIELVIFKINPDIKVEDFQKAAEKSNKALQKMDGFLHRELAVTDTQQEWADLVYWEDMDSALKAAKAFGKEPDAQEFIDMLDGKTIKMFHLNIVHNTENPQ